MTDEQQWWVSVFCAAVMLDLLFFYALYCYRTIKSRLSRFADREL